MRGRLCRLEPLEPARHAADLYSALAQDATGALWTYLPYGPFASHQAYREWLDAGAGGEDPLFYAILDAGSGKAVGLAAYLRITPSAGSIEVGHLQFSPALQRTALATEAMYLMMKHAFELGYRRYEWKCDSLNAKSRAAAERLGFTFEGIWRQAVVVKGRNRDTAWYSTLDGEWPALRLAFERWLDPGNFDGAGRQREPLSALTAPAVSRR
jgi:RimJ/RimL family protein N-acetyltransferase